MPRPNGPLCLVVLIWGFNFVSLKVLYTEMSPQAVSLWRYLLMWAALVLICRITGRKVVMDRAERWRALASGFLSMGVYMAVFLEGMAHTAPAEGAICLATSPVLTYLLAAIRKEEPWRAELLFTSLMAFVGVGMVALGGGDTGGGVHWKGNLIVLASAVCWALSATTMRPLVRRHDPLPLFTAAMPGGLPVMLLYGGVAAWQVDFTALTWVGWVHFAQVVFASGVVAFVAFYQGLAKVGPSVATAYQFLVPVVAATFGYLILQIKPTGLQIAGAFVVLAALGWMTVARSRPQVAA